MSIRGGEVDPLERQGVDPFTALYIFGARVPRPRARAASSGLSSRRSVPDSASAPLAIRGDAVGFLDELRRFPAGIPTLLGQDFPRQLAELLMHERREDRKRVRISVAPRPEKPVRLASFAT